MSYVTFESKYLGQRVDTDDFPVGGVYQCVDLIKQYMHEEFAVPFGPYGNAIDYWDKTAAAILLKLDKLPPSDVQQGDIVPLLPVDASPSHRDGHIGISTGIQTANTIEILEQNGSTGSGDGLAGNVIRKRFVPKSRVMGMLRSKPTTPVEHVEIVKPGTWNVRMTPDLGGQIRLGNVLSGQKYNTVIVGNGWRQISFRGAVGYVSPKAW